MIVRQRSTAPSAEVVERSRRRRERLWHEAVRYEGRGSRGEGVFVIVRDDGWFFVHFPAMGGALFTRERLEASEYGSRAEAEYITTGHYALWNVRIREGV